MRERYSGALKAYEELIQFIASLSPKELLAFQPSQNAREHGWGLLERQKLETFPTEEQAELEHYLEIEHIMRLAKARARQLLTHGQ